MSAQVQIKINRRDSLHVRLLLAFLAFGLIPSLVVGVISVWQSQNSLTARVNEELDRTAQAQADAIQEWIIERKDDMVVVGSTARVRTMDPAKVGEAIKQYFDQWGVYESMFLVTPDGKTMYRTDGTTPMDVSADEYFKRAMNREVVFSDAALSTTGNVVFPVAAPVEVDGKVVGVMGGLIPTTRLTKMLQTVQTGKTGEAYLINKDFYFITPSRFTDDLKKAGLIKVRTEMELQVKTDSARNVLAGKSGVDQIKGYRGQAVLSAYHPITEMNWGLIAEQNADEAFADVRNLQIVVLALAVFAGVIIVIAATALTRSITTPLSQGVAMMQEMAKGHLGMRLKMERKDEVGVLARAMDQFADDLQNVVIATMKKIAAGDLSTDVTPKDNQDEISPALKATTESLRGLVSEANLLTQAAVQGKLATRGDPIKFKGGYRQVVQGMNDTLDAVIGPLNVAAEYIDRISKGDIPPKITDHYNGDFNEIKNNLNQCIDAIDVLRDELRIVLHSAHEGNLSQRTNPERALGSYYRILGAMNDALDVMADKVFWYEQLLDAIPLALSVTDLDLKWTFMNKPVEKFMGKARQDLIGKPCSSWNASICKTENCGVECLRHDQRQVTFQRDQRDYQVETAFVLNSHGEKIGHIEVVRDVTANARRNAYTAVELDRITGNMQKLADGKLDLDLKVAEPDKHTQLTHDNYVRLNMSLGQVRDAIAALVTDANTLTHAAIEGKLSTRVDASKHQGDFGKIVQGINDTLDAVISPLRAAAEYIDRIARGDTAFTVQEEYRGDFNTIKNSLNQCTHQISILVDEVGIIINAAREGKLSQRANADHTGGVYRKILRGFNDTVDAMIAPIETTKQALGLVAQGDLTVELNGQYKGDFELLRNSIETMVHGLKGMATQSQSSAANIGAATNQILSSSTQMAATTREQASAVNQVTSTVKEIKVSAEQVAQSAQGVAAASNQALAAAEKGMAAVEDTIAGMNDIRAKVEMIAENILALSEQTQQIGEIIDTVSDIAGQSNILALNAAIEAAQAGEAGKGFRVVADEVRTLAAQSRQAAAQVKTILGDIQRATNQAVMATEQGTKGVQAGSAQVERTAQTIQELARVVESSANAAQQIVAGIEQQTIGLDQIVIGMNDINQAAQQSAAGAQQSQNAAEDLTTQTAKLKQAVAQYKM